MSKKLNPLYTIIHKFKLLAFLDSPLHPYETQNSKHPSISIPTINKTKPAPSFKGGKLTKCGLVLEGSKMRAQPPTRSRTWIEGGVTKRDNERRERDTIEGEADGRDRLRDSDDAVEGKGCGVAVVM